MSERRKILVVDDEPQIIRVMRQILSAHSYEIRTATDGQAGWELFNDWNPDLVITDLQMPNVDGLQFCADLRRISEIPIIILSVRDDENTIVGALDKGADDYIIKPFSANELLARVRANLRRVPQNHDNFSELGDFFIDFSAHKVLVKGEEVHLTPKEYELLVVFLQNPDKVLTHQILLNKVWGSYYTESSEALRVLIGSLRKKIEDNYSKPKYIITEPWIGYRFVSGG